MTFKERCKELEELIISAYNTSLTLDEAEKLSANFIHAMLQVSSELSNADLDARTRKSGVKAVRAAIYLGIVQGADKKPTENMIESTINTNELVASEQSALDAAEVYKSELERYYDIFNQAVFHFRNASKGGQG